MAKSNEHIEIKAIPDIPEVILDSAARGKLVVFIGAGVSKIVGSPLWSEFAKRALDDLFEKGEINYFDKEELLKCEPRIVLSVCTEICKESYLSLPDLGNIFRSQPELEEKYQLYEHLYEMNAIYVTTNYDDLLDKVAQKPRPARLAISKGEVEGAEAEHNLLRGDVLYLTKDLMISNLKNGTVLHIHGSIKDRSSAVITVEDYLMRYKDEYVADFLNVIFERYTVLFVGYGLEEYEVLEFLISKSKSDKRLISHFMLYPIYTNQRRLFELLTKYYRTLGVQLIGYPKDEVGYAQLAKVIEVWSKAVGPRSKPQNFLDRIKMIDEVI